VELQQDIHLVDGVVCNVYLILESGGVTMIDTGMPGRGGAVIAYLGKLGRSVHDLRNILLTHQHVDHIGNAASLSIPSGAQITAHPGDAPAIEGKAPREQPNSVVMRSMLNLLFVWRLRPLQVDNLVRAGQTLPILAGEGGLQVVETPGHTTGHISFYLPGRKLLFAGDAYRHSNGKLMPSPRAYNHDTPEALRSMAILTDYDIEASLPGHGVPILTDAGTRLGEAVARIRAIELRE
jgi:glyoxylase-like metal-dependent hydrolase (beta-lactamase superfamily II)